MWPIMVEFRSASSEIRQRKKEGRKKKESVVKYKSADNYVGRPKEEEESRYHISPPTIMSGGLMSIQEEVLQNGLNDGNPVHC